MTMPTGWPRRARADRGGRGVRLDGPHRSDFAVTHGPKAMPAPLCSTGEQKALLIALILAQARIVTGPGRRLCAGSVAGRDRRPSRRCAPRRAVRRDRQSRLPGLADGHGSDACSARSRIVRSVSKSARGGSRPGIEGRAWRAGPEPPYLVGTLTLNPRFLNQICRRPAVTRCHNSARNQVIHGT